MARLSDAPRQGWTHAGVRLGLALLLGLWASGVVLEVWPAETSFQLAAWQAGLRHTSLVLHGCGAWIACALAGRYAWPHVARVWRLPAGRTWWLGMVGAVLLAVVAATGLGLLYGAAEWRGALADVHWWTAVGWPALVLAHAMRLLTRPRAAPQAPAGR